MIYCQGLINPITIYLISVFDDSLFSLEILVGKHIKIISQLGL